MRLKWFAAAACCAALFSFSATDANAKVTLTPKSELKAQGIDADEFNLISFSPDGQKFAGWIHGTPAEIAQGIVHKIAILKISGDGNISSTKIYPINIPMIEQACWTPDGQSMVIVTKSGADYVKLDLGTGELTDIMHHETGKPGFRAYPPVVQIVEGKMLVSGYFYDDKDFAGRACLATLDPDKTGVEAFTKHYEFEPIEQRLRCSNYSYPMKDLGFLGVRNANADNYKFFCWRPDQKTIRKFDEGIENKGFWASGSRYLYSVQKTPDTYDLVVYDGKENKKFMLSEGGNTAYMYVFLSSDGTTAVVNDADDNLQRTKLFYARESEGWQMKSIEGLERGITTGTIRISPDGKRIILHNPAGIRFIDVQSK